MAGNSIQSGTAVARKFKIDCFPFIFSLEELDILEKKGDLMQALFDGRKQPTTEAERLFVKVCKNQAGPTSTMEKAWLKYLHRHRLEAALLQTDDLYREYLRIRKS